MRGYVTKSTVSAMPSLSSVTTNSRYNIPRGVEGFIVVEGWLEDANERVC